MNLSALKAAALNSDVLAEKLNRNMVALEMGETPTEQLTDEEYAIAVTVRRLSDPRFTGRTFVGIFNTDDVVDAHGVMTSESNVALAIFALLEALKISAWPGVSGKMYYRYKNHRKVGVQAAYVEDDEPEDLDEIDN
jgi:hypothetical protein